MVGAKLFVPCRVVGVLGDVELDQSVIVEKNSAGGGNRAEARGK